MNNKEQIKLLIQKHGAKSIAKMLGLTTRAVDYWKVNGLPWTEYVGKTTYAERIEAFDPEFTKAKLLDNK